MSQPGAPKDPQFQAIVNAAKSKYLNTDIATGMTRNERLAEEHAYRAFQLLAARDHERAAAAAAAAYDEDPRWRPLAKATQSLVDAKIAAAEAARAEADFEELLRKFGLSSR